MSGGSSTPAPSHQQKLIAFLALAATSTCVGTFMKLSTGNSSGGKYQFNPLSVIVMTELFKLVISLSLIFTFITKALREKQEAYETGSGSALHLEEGSAAGKSQSQALGNTTSRPPSFLDEAKNLFRENYSSALATHCFGLAVAYSIVNSVTFGVFYHASASNFFLMKACSPVLTALILKVVATRPISQVQWISILAQCVGLFVCQFDRCNKWLVSSMGYLFIIINIVVACGAGVWNEQMIKTHKASVNVQNAVLYTWGILFNLLLYFIMPVGWLGVADLSSSSSRSGSGTGGLGGGFFQGFNDWRVLAVIVSNGSVGLVITAVYKYSDVVVKTFGMAGSTAFLFLMEAAGILPAKRMPPMALSMTGAAVIFYAGYLYVAPPSLKPLTETEQKALRSEEGGGGGTNASLSSTVGKEEQDGKEVDDKKDEKLKKQQQQFGKETIEISRDKRVGTLCLLVVISFITMAFYPFPCLVNTIEQRG